MRELKTGDKNPQTIVLALDEPEFGGNHLYSVLPINANVTQETPVPFLIFQKGGRVKAGVNGLTHEEVLAALIDRYDSFQAGPMACEENATVLDLLNKALTAELERKARRIAAATEGTSKGN